MRRMLAVVGSPRRGGNTDILVSKIADGARAAGADVEQLFLGKMTVRECDGCHLCWQGDKCSKSDDMTAAYAKITASDVIIFGTPIYWYGPSGLMKVFIDRFVYFNCEANRNKIKGKEAVVAIVLEEENVETARLTVEFFEKSLAYLEMRLAAKIIVPGVGGKGDILRKEDRLNEAVRMGRGLAQVAT